MYELLKKKKKGKVEIEIERTEYQEMRVRSSFKLHTKTFHLPLPQARIGRNGVLNIDPTHLKKAHLTIHSS